MSKKTKIDRSCWTCGKPGKVRGIATFGYANVYLCKTCWAEIADKQGEIVRIERD